MNNFYCKRHLVYGLIILALCSLNSQAEDIGFNGANWIWHTPTLGESSGDYEPGVRYFRTEFNLPESSAIKWVEIAISCDNLFVLHVNGKTIGASESNNDAWRTASRFNVTDLLAPGKIVLAVEAINTLRGPSGLLLKFVAALEDNTQIVITSDAKWKTWHTFVANWEQPGFNDQKWSNAQELAQYGAGPWGEILISEPLNFDNAMVAKVQQLSADITASARDTQKVKIQEPDENFSWPEGLIYVGDDCSLYLPRENTGNSAMDSLSVTIFNPNNSRAFPEHDLPGPMKVGRKLMALKPARPGVTPQVLLDAGSGALGSPSVSFDGNWIYFSMAKENDSFFHLYRIAAEGGEPVQLTSGPFFDIDPAELPDGRIVLVSTRVGTFEEYHSPPARALYVMNADGSNLHFISNTIIFDNEPEVLADGRILFIRTDNFFDRGKVETLLHSVFPDGSRGYTEFALENAPEYGNRLRAYYCGSPAPMQDGRVAFLSNTGINIGRAGSDHQHIQHIPIEAGDVAALPDNRLMCTVRKRGVYDSINILDPTALPPLLTKVFEDPRAALHSPVYLGARQKPTLRPDQVSPPTNETQASTGYLICQNARFTQNTTAGWDRIQAIRVLAGKGLTTRSSHSYIVHAGNETVELGTVPLESDGSFAIEVPADTPIALQAVDAEGRSELNEMSWIYVRPGERKSCVGCHQSRQSTPLANATRPLALASAPLKLLGEGSPHHFRGNNAAVTGLMELQFDRFREVAGINRYAESTDQIISEKEEIKNLITQLQDEDKGNRKSAAQRLALSRDRRATPHLLERMKDEEREVRVAATLALASCGTRDAVLPLVNVLPDNDSLVARGALIALENLTGRYQKDAQQGINAHEQWIKWFENTTWSSIEDQLMLEIKTGNREAVRNAAVAIGHIGSNRCQDVLLEYLLEKEKDNPFPEWQRAGNVGDNARFNAQSEVNPRSLQAVIRALGYVGDSSAVSPLYELLKKHNKPNSGNLFLAEAAAEALGLMRTREAETALIEAFGNLRSYHEYTRWYGDHDALMACHASPIHFFIIQALDTIESRRAREIVPDLIRSVPIDPDRALLFVNDDYETLVGRILRRHDMESKITETCLAILGDKDFIADPKIEEALSEVVRCWAGHPNLENRAAQILSLTCRNKDYALRIEEALMRYCKMDSGILRVFNTGIPIVDALPTENWVSFYLARTLGYLGVQGSSETLITILENAPAEAASGRPDPLGPGVMFLHNALTPCWRAAIAWALGRIGDKSAIPILLNIVQDMDNATDTRHAAAVALGQIADSETRKTIQVIASDYPEQSTRLALINASLIKSK